MPGFRGREPSRTPVRNFLQVLVSVCAEWPDTHHSGIGAMEWLGH